MAKGNIRKTVNVASLVRLLKFLPSTDLTLIVLKGHLLIEEQLVSLIEANVKYSVPLRGGFTFSQRLRLAKAICHTQETVWLWRSIEKLNAVRNHLAHHLEASDLKVKVNDFINSIGGGFRIDRKASIEKRARGVLICICGALEGLQKQKPL